LCSPASARNCDSASSERLRSEAISPRTARSERAGKGCDRIASVSGDELITAAAVMPPLVESSCSEAPDGNSGAWPLGY